MSRSMKQLVPWGVLVLVLAAIGQILSPARPREPAGDGWVMTLLIAVAVGVAFFGLARFGEVGAAHRAALDASRAHLEAGRLDEAEECLDAVLASKLPGYRRAAEQVRAAIAARRG